MIKASVIAPFTAQFAFIPAVKMRQSAPVNPNWAIFTAPNDFQQQALSGLVLPGIPRADSGVGLGVGISGGPTVLDELCNLGILKSCRNTCKFC